MTTVIYMSNKKVHIIQGEQQEEELLVEKADLYDTPEGAVINGVVIQEDLLRGFLEQLWTEHGYSRKNVCLVLDSTKFISQKLVVPLVSRRKERVFIQHELLHMKCDEDVVFYPLELAVFPKEKRREVLVNAVEPDYIRTWEVFFTAMGIHLDRIDTALNCTVRLMLEQMKEHKKPCMVMIQEGNIILSMILVDGIYFYSNRRRILHEEGEAEYVQEVGQLIDQLIQFGVTQHLLSPIQTVFFYGVSRKNWETVRSQLQQMIPGPIFQFQAGNEHIRMLEQVQREKQLPYTVGALYQTANEENYIRQAARSRKRTGKKKSELQRLAEPGIYTALFFAVCIAMVVIVSRVQDARLEKLYDSIADPDHMMDAAQYDLVLEQEVEQAGQLQEAQLAVSLLKGYPAVDRAFLDSLRECAGTRLTIGAFSYLASTGALSFSISTDSVQELQSFLERLEERAFFAELTYSGYRFDSQTGQYSASLVGYLYAADRKEEETEGEEPANAEKSADKEVRGNDDQQP